MQFEQCEIGFNRYGSFAVNFDFVAEAIGPHGTYIAARTPQFGAYDPSKPWQGMGSYRVDYPDDKPFQRQFFNALVSFLVHTGWEPLAASGAYWFSRRFQRSVSLSVPDPEPANPYTLGDGKVWRKKSLKALDRYEKQKDTKSCRELAEAFMQLGLALEREHQFQDALTNYLQAGQFFEEISLTDEAAKAYLWAERVLHRK